MTHEANSSQSSLRLETPVSPEERGAPEAPGERNRSQTLEEREAEVRKAVQYAAVPALLMVVYQFTADERWLGKRYRPTREKGLGPHDSGGLPEDVQQEIRDAAVPVLLALIAGERPATEAFDDDETIRLASIYLGEAVDPRYGELLSSELRRRSGVLDEPDEPEFVLPPAGFKTIIIGAGIAGIAGIRLMQQLGVEYTVFERSPKAGGVWYDNTYPGAGVDTPSHLYSFAFGYNDWDKFFALRDEIQEYTEYSIDLLGARDKVQFETEVLSADYDDETALWTVVTQKRDGTTESHRANIVLSAVGALNKPRLPKIPGMERFKGVQFHSARWPSDLDVSGKRVAIVGVGASSQQISPEIAGEVERLTIFQRSPQWVAPFELFRKEIPAAQRVLLESVPAYYAWTWVRYFWQFGDKVIETLRVDPDWPHQERSVNARNDGHRKFFTRYLSEQLEGREDLIEKVVPDYPPFGKRILLDNGWYKMMLRDNVDVRTTGVTSVDETGLVGEDGVHIDADVIVWATGFDASYFLDSLEVHGAEGLHLREVWQEDNPRAYLGMTIPHFPNFFMLGGPHSFPGSGSFMYFMEVQARYLRELITNMFAQDVTAIAPTDEATDRYNELVDELHARTVWTHPGFGTYYRNSRGRVIFVMPFTNIEYWELTQDRSLEPYERVTVPYVPANADHSSSTSQ